ncbi:unnamed protein product [Bursaphelenchus okinawaensis]|uniref:Hexosyltransferase n=1 Tax=Bursaphelenchus okinawaensis TaxID=465554 RepID=A0A811JQD4_9BILA|nr:unnamed protein product [Bursaphelenchus okinawaensis]CAG9077654.1 unnamed protein product [Bursaphelenchus okinawaensis]
MAKVVLHRRSFVTLVLALFLFLTWTTLSILSPSNNKKDYFIVPEGMYAEFNQETKDDKEFREDGDLLKAEHDRRTDPMEMKSDDPNSKERGQEINAAKLKELQAAIVEIKKMAQRLIEAKKLQDLNQEALQNNDAQNPQVVPVDQPQDAQAVPANPGAVANNQPVNAQIAPENPALNPQILQGKVLHNPQDLGQNLAPKQPQNVVQAQAQNPLQNPQMLQGNQPLNPDILQGNQAQNPPNQPLNPQNQPQNPQDQQNPQNQAQNPPDENQNPEPLPEVQPLNSHGVQDAEDKSYPDILPAQEAPERTPEQHSFEASLKLDEFRLQFANYRLNYKMLRPAEDVCNNKKAIVMIMSIANSVRAQKQRQAFRLMFQNQTEVAFVYRFIVGFQKDMMVEELSKEMEEFNDIVYYDAEDTYYNNFIKWYAMHDWHQSYCKQVEYFIKLDDDAVIVLDRAFKWAERDFDGKTTGIKDYVACQGIFRKGPIRNHRNKWYVPEEEYKYPLYPDWCAGYLVLMPSSTVGLLLDAVHNANKLHIDDVLFTGIARYMTNTTLVDFIGNRETLHPHIDCAPDGLIYPYSMHHAKTSLSLLHKYRQLRELKCSP